MSELRGKPLLVVGVSVWCDIAVVAVLAVGRDGAVGWLLAILQLLVVVHPVLI